MQISGRVFYNLTEKYPVPDSVNSGEYWSSGFAGDNKEAIQKYIGYTEPDGGDG